MFGKTVTLNSGYKMPALGIGTNELKARKEGIREAVKTAINVGYRLIDTGPTYSTEKLVGEAIKETIDAGVVKREDLFIVSKLWNTKHRYEKVVPACKKSIQDLGLDYVDLYLINWPLDYREENPKMMKAYDLANRLTGEVDYIETWKGMEDCVKLGLTRSIGLSNFNVNQIYRVLKNARIRPAVSQDECHLLLSQRRLMIYCRLNEIVVMGYSPLGNPGYLNSLSSSSHRKIYENSIVEAISKKYRKTKAQVALRFLVDNDVVPIPKATTHDHIVQNITIGDFQLSEEENEILHDFDCQYRISKSYIYEAHPRYPFHNGYWD